MQTNNFVAIYKDSMIKMYICPINYTNFKLFIPNEKIIYCLSGDVYIVFLC